MVRFIVIYRDRCGANHTTAVEATTSRRAIVTVLQQIPEADSAWVVCST